MQRKLAFAGRHLLALGVFQVPQQDLVRQGQGPAQLLADGLQILFNGRIGTGDHLGGGLNGDHTPSSWRSNGPGLCRRVPGRAIDFGWMEAHLASTASHELRVQS